MLFCPDMKLFCLFYDRFDIRQRSHLGRINDYVARTIFSKGESGANGALCYAVDFLKKANRLT